MDILEELRFGAKEELEHTSDPDEARRIALDHLREDPHYYTKLRECGLTEAQHYGSDVRRLRASYLVSTETVRASLLECLARKILAGIRETNAIQVLLADEMKMDLLDWIQQFAHKFRSIYESNQEIKNEIDTGHLDSRLVKQLSGLLK